MYGFVEVQDEAKGPRNEQMRNQWLGQGQVKVNLRNHMLQVNTYNVGTVDISELIFRLLLISMFVEVLSTLWTLF